MILVGLFTVVVAGEFSRARPRVCTDARCTGDREQQLHGEGRTMEAPRAFPW